MTGSGPQDRLGRVPGPPPRAEPWAGGSPAVVLTAVLGVLGLLTALNEGALAVSLFFSASALAALPLALADRPGGKALGYALLGAASAGLALLLVLSPLLTGDEQRRMRTSDPVIEDDRPSLPGPARPTSTPTPDG